MSSFVCDCSKAILSRSWPKRINNGNRVQRDETRSVGIGRKVRPANWRKFSDRTLAARVLRTSRRNMRQATGRNAESRVNIRPPRAPAPRSPGIDYHRRRGGTFRLNTSSGPRSLARKSGAFLRRRRRRRATGRRRRRRRRRSRRSGQVGELGPQGLIRGLADAGIHIACPGTYLLASLYTIAKTRLHTSARLPRSQPPAE